MAFSQSDRLKALPPYLFVEIDRKRRAALDTGHDVIDLGIGDPDQPTPSFIVDRMAAAIRVSANHRYPANEGSPAFRREIAAFFHRRYGVTLDPAREILALIGTKEGLGHLPLAVVNPGRTVLVPDPGYPVYQAGAILAGGRSCPFRLRAEGGWLPDFDAIPADDARDAVLLYLNYPNNPTGALATRDCFERAVAFARRHDLIIAHDAAYAETYFAGDRPPSILETPGGRDVAVEFHSLSKTFNMTGWRLGFAAGQPDVLAALARVKSNVDSGAFTAVQDAGIEAYQGLDRPELAQAREAVRQRAETLADALGQVGFSVASPRATFYVWAGAPTGHNDMDTVNKLLDEARIVCIPGTGFGAGGTGFVRFAVTVDIERIRQACTRLRELKW
ncbi:MAG: LL-diaminopimelate aminotransferase [Phycisphaerae bacterium]|jgi:LL-diaminopimelate aminotransferase